MAAVLLFWNTNMAAVTSCEYALLNHNEATVLPWMRRSIFFLFEAPLRFVFKESRCCHFKTVSRHLLISFLLSLFVLYLFLLWRTDWDKQAELVSESLIFVENYQDVVHFFSPVRGFLPYVASVCFVLHARRSLAFARLQNQKNAYRFIASLVSLKWTTTERGHMVSLK